MSLSTFVNSTFPSYQFRTTFGDQQFLRYDDTTSQVLSADLGEYQPENDPSVTLVWAQTGGTGAFAPPPCESTRIPLTDGKFLTSVKMPNIQSSTDNFDGTNPDIKATTPAGFGCSSTSYPVGVGVVTFRGAGGTTERFTQVQFEDANTLRFKITAPDAGAATLDGTTLTWISD